ncbi:hypothetical protein Scep_024988 [Stephania cephalantha]|uniref:Sn1-specific diacylglycerol lipase alpha n=1 Tax=Stephania cephalantha TaxID=152367 RepID=A0AAP0F4U9_9MAGN
MATATMATTAGAAAFLYYALKRRIRSSSGGSKKEDEAAAEAAEEELVVDRVSMIRTRTMPVHAPATWLDTISTLSETLRFTYSETLGKWPIGDLAFGINFLLKRQGNFQVSSVFGGKDCVRLEGPEIIDELRHLLKLLTLCWHFSKKPFPLFLEETGYSLEDVLLQEPKSGILKPAFTILADKSSKCFLLLVRGTHSIKDTLTVATGAVVPFHHTVVSKGGVSDLVLGYAHCGMVAASRWIAKLATPCLIKALSQYPEYKIKIVGHSLGGGTAALLTYALREQQEFSTATCVTFAPAACMTWELAESGQDFITSVINGADLVPTFSAASVDDLRAEVTSSAWLNDLRDQIEQTRILSTVYRSASALGSRLPSVASARAKVAGAGAILRPVTSGTQVVMRRAWNVAEAAWSHPSMKSWSCIGPRHRNVADASTSEEQRKALDLSASSYTVDGDLIMSHETSAASESSTVSTSTAQSMTTSEATSSGLDHRMNSDTEEIDDGDGTQEDRMTEFELWEQLEHELHMPTDAEASSIAEEMKREEEEAEAETGLVDDSTSEESMPEMKEAHRFFPAGKIMHIVTFPAADPNCSSEAESLMNTNNEQDENAAETKIGIFLTPRSLYSKLRLTQTMISDHLMPAYRRQIEQLIGELEKQPVPENSSN